MYGTLVQVHANSFQGGNVKKTPWLSQTKNLNSTLSAGFVAANIAQIRLKIWIE